MICVLHHPPLEPRHLLANLARYYLGIIEPHHPRWVDHSDYRSSVVSSSCRWCFYPLHSTRRGTNSLRDREPPAGCHWTRSGRSIVFSESSLLDSAVAAFEEATFRSDLPAAARVNAAGRFRAIIATPLPALAAGDEEAADVARAR